MAVDRRTLCSLLVNTLNESIEQLQKSDATLDMKYIQRVFYILEALNLLKCRY